MLYEGLMLIVLAIFFSTLIWKLMKKSNFIMREKMFLCAFNAVVFIFSATLVCQLNFASDEVTIVAMGQNGSMSDSDTIKLEKFVIDAREYEVTDIVKGKWYYGGNCLVWRNKTNTPALTEQTDSIVVRVPVGSHRQIYFKMADYAGYVQVFDRTEEYIIDTSIQEFQTLESSPTWKIVGTMLLRVIIIMIVMVVSILLSLLVLRNYRYTNGGTYHIVALPVCMLVFVFMWHNGDKQCFWIDEMYQIAFVSGSIGDVLSTSLHSISDPPIYNTLAWIWFNIVPHTEKWLLLLPELITILTMYLMGYFAVVNVNWHRGVITLLLAISTELLYIQCAFENRQYALWILMCVLLLQAHYKFIENKTKKTIGIYMLMLVLAMLTQYISVFLCLGLFICDVILLRQKKETKLVMLPYLIGAGMALPFAIAILVKYVQRFDASTGTFLQFWANTPDVNSIVDAVQYLVKSDILWLLLLAFGIAHIVVKMANKKAEWHEWILIELPVLFFSISYFYSTCVNRSGSVWVNRYFTMLLPIIIMIVAMETEYLIKYFCASKIMLKTTMVALGLFMGIQCWDNVAAFMTKQREPYEEAADWLYDQTKDIYNDTTLVIDCEYASASRAWNYFYLTQRGLRDEINCVSFSEVDPATLTNYEKIYMVRLHGDLEVSQSVQSILDEHYKEGSGKSGYSIKEYTLKK